MNTLRLPTTLYLGVFVANLALGFLHSDGGARPQAFMAVPAALSLLFALIAVQAHRRGSIVLRDASACLFACLALYLAGRLTNQTYFRDDAIAMALVAFSAILAIDLGMTRAKLGLVGATAVLVGASGLILLQRELVLRAVVPPVFAGHTPVPVDLPLLLARALLTERLPSDATVFGLALGALAFLLVGLPAPKDDNQRRSRRGLRMITSALGLMAAGMAAQACLVTGHTDDASTFAERVAEIASLGATLERGLVPRAVTSVLALAVAVSALAPFMRSGRRSKGMLLVVLTIVVVVLPIGVDVIQLRALASMARSSVDATPAGFAPFHLAQTECALTRAGTSALVLGRGAARIADGSTIPYEAASLHEAIDRIRRTDGSPGDSDESDDSLRIYPDAHTGAAAWNLLADQAAAAGFTQLEVAFVAVEPRASASRAPFATTLRALTPPIRCAAPIALADEQGLPPTFAASDDTSTILGRVLVGGSASPGVTRESDATDAQAAQDPWARARESDLLDRGTDPFGPDRVARVLFEGASATIAPDFTGLVACRAELTRGTWDDAGEPWGGDSRHPDLVGSIAQGAAHEPRRFAAEHDSSPAWFAVPVAHWREGEALTLTLEELDAPFVEGSEGMGRSPSRIRIGETEIVHRRGAIEPASIGESRISCRGAAPDPEVIASALAALDAALDAYDASSDVELRRATDGFAFRGTSPAHVEGARMALHDWVTDRDPAYAERLARRDAIESAYLARRRVFVEALKRAAHAPSDVVALPGTTMSVRITEVREERSRTRPSVVLVLELHTSGAASAAFPKMTLESSAATELLEEARSFFHSGYHVLPMSLRADGRLIGDRIERSDVDDGSIPAGTSRWRVTISPRGREPGPLLLRIGSGESSVFYAIEPDPGRASPGRARAGSPE